MISQKTKAGQLKQQRNLNDQTTQQATYVYIIILFLANFLYVNQ